MTDTTNMSEQELAEHYNRTEDLSEWDGAVPVPAHARRRDVTISVRFSAEEIEQLRAHADAAGEKVTAYIRAAALDTATARRRTEVSDVVTMLEADLARLRHAID